MNDTLRHALEGKRESRDYFLKHLQGLIPLARKLFLKGLSSGNTSIRALHFGRYGE